MKRPAEPSVPDSAAKKPTQEVATEAGPVQVSIVGASSDITDIIDMDLPGTGKPQGANGSPGTDEYHLPIKRTNFGSRQSTYSKTFQISSECFFSHTLPIAAGVLCSSELLEIPWHLPVMYMTPSEFGLIQRLP